MIFKVPVYFEIQDDLITPQNSKEYIEEFSKLFLEHLRTTLVGKKTKDTFQEKVVKIEIKIPKSRRGDLLKESTISFLNTDFAKELLRSNLR